MCNEVGILASVALAGCVTLLVHISIDFFCGGPSCCNAVTSKRSDYSTFVILEVFCAFNIVNVRRMLPVHSPECGARLSSHSH